MDSQKELDLLTGRIREYKEKEHMKNRRRIKNGFLSMLIVPSIFLVLLFMSELTGTSKLIMLMIWIASMFVISVYLITIEYMDFKLMNMLKGDTSEGEASPEGQEDET